MALAAGDTVPADLPVLTPVGEEVPLGALLRGRDTLVIFLRHLG
jgi:hypothetical protein